MYSRQLFVKSHNMVLPEVSILQNGRFSIICDPVFLWKGFIFSNEGRKMNEKVVRCEKEV